MKTLTLFDAYVRVINEIADITLFDPTLELEENSRHFDRRDRLASKLEAKIRERLEHLDNIHHQYHLAHAKILSREAIIEQLAAELDAREWLDVTEKEPR